MRRITTRRKPADWVDVQTATALTGRSEVTLRRWRRTGLVRSAKRQGMVGRYYDRHTLLDAMRTTAANQRATRFDGSTPGPGRGGKPVNDERQLTIDFDCSCG